MVAQAFESVSSWNQPVPAAASASRTQLIDGLAAGILEQSPRRLRVAIDGLTASGKTSFAHELAVAVRTRGRPTMRATFDDFKKPWSEAGEQGYDRISGDGYYRNAPDFESARKLLLEPAGPEGSGVVVLCARDPLTGTDHRSRTIVAPQDAVLIVDSVFAMRPHYDEFWDLRVWLEVPTDLALRRGIERDAPRDGRSNAERIHHDRYQVAERIYLDEVDPRTRADVVIDNTDLARPIIVPPS